MTIFPYPAAGIAFYAVPFAHTAGQEGQILPGDLAFEGLKTPSGNKSFICKADINGLYGE